MPIDTPGHADDPTTFELLVRSAAKGHVSMIKKYAENLRSEFNGYSTTGRKTHKGHIETREGGFTALSEPSLERFLEDMIEEAHYIKSITQQHLETLRLETWKAFYESRGLEVPEFSEEMQIREQKNGKYGQQLHEALGVAFQSAQIAGACEAAKHHIEQEEVDWHKAWERFPWYNAYAAIDPKTYGPSDNSYALDAVTVLGERMNYQACRAIIDQYILERFASHVNEMEQAEGRADGKPWTEATAQRGSRERE